MKNVFFIIISVFTYFVSYSQADTVFVKQQKGFLFLSSYHYLYDYNGGDIRPLGFNDFFYPVKDFNVELFNDSNINIHFKNGVRVDFISSRKQLKAKAKSFLCYDSSQCYKYDSFYVVPVIVDYKYFKDNWPLECHRNYYELQVKNGSKSHFEYLQMAMLPTKILVVPSFLKKK